VVSTKIRKEVEGRPEAGEKTFAKNSRMLAVGHKLF